MNVESFGGRQQQGRTNVPRYVRDSEQRIADSFPPDPEAWTCFQSCVKDPASSCFPAGVATQWPIPSSTQKLKYNSILGFKPSFCQSGVETKLSAACCELPAVRPIQQMMGSVWRVGSAKTRPSHRAHLAEQPSILNKPAHQISASNGTNARKEQGRLKNRYFTAKLCYLHLHGSASYISSSASSSVPWKRRIIWLTHWK